MTTQNTKIDTKDISDETDKLLKSIQWLSTFDQVKEWDEKATAQISRVLTAIHNLDDEIKRLNQEFQQAQAEHQEKPFLNRLFSSSPERKFKSGIDELENQKAALEALAEELQTKIDFTPNSSEEQKVLIRELKLRKKELNAHKREVAATMKEIRTKARQDSANVSVSVGALFAGSKYTAAQRRAIRYEKEAQLTPHEDEKASIERQLVETDRLIIWAERFK